MTRTLAAFAIAVAAALAAGADGGVDAVLDDFHRAASEAAAERYFSHFAPGAIFLGTDPGERWTVAEFREYAEPHFSRGQGWTYTPVERHVVVGEGGAVAWFDELLDNDNYGRCRGTGVLKRTAGGWKIAHYSLTLVVPNAAARDVAKLIRESSSEGETEAAPTPDE